MVPFLLQRIYTVQEALIATINAQITLFKLFLFKAEKFPKFSTDLKNAIIYLDVLHVENKYI